MSSEEVKKEEVPAETGGTVDDSDKPAAEGEPLVKILDKEQLKTNEESEETLYKDRARLWRFASDTNEWKERGTGDVKLLEHKETKKIRILMRREKTLKICANHYVDPLIELKEHSGSSRAWLWTAAADLADEEAKSEVFAIRFANAEAATAFKEAYDKAREAMKALRDGSDTKPAAEAEKKDEEKKE